MTGVLLFGLAQVGLPSAPAPATTNAVAIWRLKPLGMDSATADRLETLLRAEAGRIEGVSLQAQVETDSKLTERADLLACGGETACLCEIGKALGVDRLVTGVIGALGDDYTFDLKLVEMASCREERRINEALSGREDVLIGAIRQALYKLVEPRLYIGSLSVEVPVEQAEVLVDGRPVGTTPLAKPIGDLRPGVHRLQIVKAGFSEFQDEVPVRFQQTTRVKVDLVKSVLTGLSYEKEEPVVAPAAAPAVSTVEKQPGPSTWRILAWSSTGLALAATAAAGICAWQVQVARDELEAAANADPPYLNSEHQKVYDRGEAFALGANIGWAVAGAAAAAALTLFIIDWTADGEDEAAPPGAAAAWMLEPILGQDGGGVGMRLAF
jgi:hypothetical protein